MKDKVTEREGQRDCPSIHWFLCPGRGQNRPDAGAWPSSWVVCRGDGAPGTCTILCCFINMLAGLNGSRAVRTQNQCSYAVQCPQHKHWLNLMCHDITPPAPARMLFLYLSYSVNGQIFSTFSVNYCIDVSFWFSAVRDLWKYIIVSFIISSKCQCCLFG